MVPLLVNKFLCFLTVQFNKINRENLISTLVEYYTFSQALEAKNVLTAECKNISITDSVHKFTVKRMIGKAGAVERVVTDVVDIWTFVDQEKAGKLAVQFVAANPNHLPNTNLEKFSLQFFISSIEKLQEKV